MFGCSPLCTTMTYLHGRYTWYITLMNLPQKMLVIATMNHILNCQQWQLTHLSEKCPWTYTGTRGHCCLWSICTAKCHWQQTTATRGKSARKKWCKYWVMRTRLQCMQFLCVWEPISRIGMGENDRNEIQTIFWGKFVVCGYDPQQFKTLVPNYFSKVSPHTCYENRQWGLQ